MKTNAEILSTSWADFKGNWKNPMLATLLYLIIVGGCSSLLSEIGAAFAGLSIFISLPIGVAISQTFLYFQRGMRGQCIDTMLHKTFREYLRSLSLGGLVYIYTLLWSLLLIVPGIIKALSYAMTNYIAVDHPDWSVEECINESMRLMQGHKLQLFLLWLVFVGLSLLSVFTLGIALLWFTPWMYNAQAAFYENLKQQA